MSFRDDHKQGRDGEAYVQRLLAKADIPNILNDSADQAVLAKWDIEFVLAGEAHRIESKLDLYASLSGNVAIEYYNPKQGRESGIAVTAADLWVHVLYPWSAWVTSVVTLRDYIKNTRPLRTVECGGDSNSSMYLYRKERIFEDIFNRMEWLTTTQLRNLLSDLVRRTTPCNTSKSFSLWPPPISVSEATLASSF